MAVSKVNEIIETQKRLAEQLRSTQQQQAQDTYNQGQRALVEQLRGQRQENQANLGIICPFWYVCYQDQPVEVVEEPSASPQ